MTTKAEPNVLELASQVSDLSAAGTSLMPRRDRWELIEGEKQITEQERGELLIIDINAVKGCYAVTKIEQIVRHSARAYDEALSAIIEIKEQPGRSEQHQAYVDAFAKLQVQLLVKHELEVIDASMINIGAVARRSSEWPPSRPPAPPNPPKRHVGLLERFFGS